MAKWPYRVPARYRKGLFYDILLSVNARTLLPDPEVLSRTPKPLSEEERLVSLWRAWREVIAGNRSAGLKTLEEVAQVLFYRPEPFIFLGMVGLWNGDRKTAVTSFQRALKVDPRYPLIPDLLRKMGIRRPPVLSFLPRNHWLNVVLGKLRHRLYRYLGAG